MRFLQSKLGFLLFSLLLTTSGCGKDSSNETSKSSQGLSSCKANATTVVNANYVRAIDTAKSSNVLIVTQTDYISKGNNTSITTFEGKDYSSENELDGKADVFDLVKNVSYSEGDKEEDYVGIKALKSEEANTLLLTLNASADEFAQAKKSMIESSQGGITDVCSIDTSNFKFKIDRNSERVTISGQMKIQFVIKQ